MELDAPPDIYTVVSHSPLFFGFLLASVGGLVQDIQWYSSFRRLLCSHSLPFSLSLSLSYSFSISAYPRFLSLIEVTEFSLSFTSYYTCIFPNHVHLLFDVPASVLASHLKGYFSYLLSLVAVVDAAAFISGVFGRCYITFYHGSMV
jgi:hypothetical protein